jgi:hypothetical protein
MSTAITPSLLCGSGSKSWGGSHGAAATDRSRRKTRPPLPGEEAKVHPITV